MAFKEAQESAKLLSFLEMLAASKIKCFKAGSLAALSEIDYKEVRMLLDSYVKSKELSIFFRYYNPDKIGEYFDFEDANKIPINSYFTSKTDGEEYYISEDDEFELWYKFSDQLYEELNKNHKIPKELPSGFHDQIGVSPNRIQGNPDIYEAKTVQQIYVYGDINMSSTFNNNGTVNGAFGENNTVSNNTFNTDVIKQNQKEIIDLFDELCEKSVSNHELNKMLIQTKKDFLEKKYDTVRESLSVIDKVAKTAGVVMPALKQLAHLFGF